MSIEQFDQSLNLRPKLELQSKVLSWLSWSSTLDQLQLVEVEATCDHCRANPTQNEAGSASETHDMQSVLTQSSNSALSSNISSPFP